MVFDFVQWGMGEKWRYSCADGGHDHLVLVTGLHETGPAVSSAAL